MLILKNFMRFLGHFTVGMIAAAAFVALFGISPSTALACFAIIVGSVFPDIDHPFSYARRVFVFVLFLAIAVFAYPLIGANREQIANFCKECSGPFAIALLTLVAAGVLTLVINFLIPFHRGPLHGILAAIAFGLGLAVLAIRLAFNPVHTGLAAFGGYLLHLVCDIGER